MKRLACVIILLNVATLTAGARKPSFRALVVVPRAVWHETELTAKAMVRDPVFASIAVAQLAAANADAGTTAYIFANCPRCYENGFLARGTHSGARVELETNLFDLGIIVGAHAIYRRGDWDTDNRLGWRLLGGAAMGFFTGAHARQALSNAQFWGAIKNTPLSTGGTK